MIPEKLQPIFVRNRRASRTHIERELPDARIVDVTSRGDEPWRRLSPMYPHGGIPVPNWSGCVSMTVEGIWQGLKCFENEGPDPAMFEWRGQGPVKRSSRGRSLTGAARGRVLGHQWGQDPSIMLSYIDARQKIYLPAYVWMLRTHAREEVERLRALARERSVVLLDYATNDRIDDASRPLSHAALIRAYVLDSWPAI